MATVHSTQDIYPRHLVSGHGNPLWTPEPCIPLPCVYHLEGVKIGDVGVVVPQDGSFDVFFNVCLPPTHSLHLETGVPDNFTPILLKARDIAIFPEAEGAGRIISTSSVTRLRGANTADDNLERHAEPGSLNYQFTPSSQEGAVLILPEGAESCYLRKERPFLEAAIRHAADWYAFAEQRLGRIISHDSLYLITGFYKARSWPFAAYEQGSGTGDALTQFRAVQVGRGNIAACYTTQAMDWRVGPSDEYYNGKPNQSVFIQGFKIAIRKDILGSKWVKAKADGPSVEPYPAEFSSSSWFSDPFNGVLGNSSSSTSNSPIGTRTSSNMGNTTLVDQRDNARDDITVHRFPQAIKPFHPSDIINQHLLREFPSATVAVTHDSQWTTLLEKGLLKLGELSQEDRLIREVTSNYLVMPANEGAVYLESKPMEEGVNDNAKTASVSSEPGGHLDPSLVPPNAPFSAPATIPLTPARLYGEEHSSQCFFCLSSPREVMLLPCRHPVACEGCAAELAEFGEGSSISHYGFPTTTANTVANGTARQGGTDGANTSSMNEEINSPTIHSLNLCRTCPVCRQPCTSLLRIDANTTANTVTDTTEADIPPPSISTPSNASGSTSALFNDSFSDKDAIELAAIALGLTQYCCGWTSDGVRCGQPILGKDVLEHLRTAHGVERVQVGCLWDECREVLSKGHLVRHVQEKHLEYRWPCPRCSAVFTRRGVLTKHLTGCHA